jgi:hypothetical protein
MSIYFPKAKRNERKELSMDHQLCLHRIGAVIACLVVVSITARYGAQAAPRAPACAEIRAACQQAGFAQGGAKAGDGIVADCLRPIMQGRPQSRRASKPLPEIDPQLVAACKAQNPSFGQGNRTPAPRARPPAPPAPPTDEPPASRSPS